MNIFIASKLMKDNLKCPKCGSSKVGNGEGKITIEDHTFYRSCKCGWEVKLEYKD